LDREVFSIALQLVWMLGEKKNLSSISNQTMICTLSSL
jgi:hypothetical protein